MLGSSDVVVSTIQRVFKTLRNEDVELVLVAGQAVAELAGQGVTAPAGQHVGQLRTVQAL